ncbi:hypothetical protein D3C78_1626100 [compost metagenome]
MTCWLIERPAPVSTTAAHTAKVARRRSVRRINQVRMACIGLRPAFSCSADCTLRLAAEGLTPK